MSRSMVRHSKKRKKARARRRNPVPVFVANPRRRRRRRRRHAFVSAPKRRVRRHRRRRSHPSTAIARRSNPIRRIRRRRNPLRLSFRSLTSGGMIKALLFGGLGIVCARIGKYLYTRYLSGMVLGSSPGTARRIISDVLSVAAMGLATYGTNKALKRMVSQESARAHLYGGYAETGRTAIGLIANRVLPQKYIDAAGLSGNGQDNYDQLSPEMQQYLALMSGVEPASSFQGVEPASSFQGVEPASSFEGSHPFAAGY